MALDRVVTLWPSLTALSSRTGGVAVWTERTTRTNLVALGEAGAYDVSGLIARESVTMRMRWRADVSLRSVFSDGDGAVWLIERLAEVGRHQWLDVAVTNFVNTDGTQTLGVWPILTSPYTPQAGWALTDAAGAAVQNLYIRQWNAPSLTFTSTTLPAPTFGFDATSDRVGYWTAYFNAVNVGIRGTVLSLSSTTGFNWRTVVRPRGIRVQAANGRRGWLHVWLATASATYRAQATDAYVPLDRGAQAGAFQVFFDGSADPGLRIGGALRVLSTQELQ